MAPLRGLPLLLETGLHVHLTPPALRRERISTVKSVSPCPEGARVLFSCAGNLDEAEALSGCFVLAATSDIELGPMDAAYDDLLGRDVVDERHGVLGSIIEVMETPANDVWVVSGAAFGEVLIPVIDDVVSFIPEQGPIPVRIMDGLLNL